MHFRIVFRMENFEREPTNADVLATPEITGAVANADYHATGIRVRDLPIIVEALKNETPVVSTLHG